MKDARIAQLAHHIIRYSVDLKPGENILLEIAGSADPLAQALIHATYEAGGVPFLSLTNPTLDRELMKGFTQKQIQNMARWDLARMKEMQAYVGIRAGENVNELADIPSEIKQEYNMYYSKPVHSQQRVAHTKWCVLRYPNYSMAQLAEMSLEAFEDFYFDVCNLDYAKMSAAMEPLLELMGKTERVRITGPGTELEFSIKGIPAVKCDGKMNLPDGEVFTAPVRDSVEGKITFHTPSVYQGQTFEGVALEFSNGKIVKAKANAQEKLERILTTDEGACYIGEFAFGVNPLILKPMKDTLFDEKIAGSFHFTPGAAYDEADNGNRSAIHWDLVSIQRPDYGGGEIYFDGKLIRKDGSFVPKELQGLNPENLI